MANKQKQMLAVWGSPGAGKTVTAVKLALELSKRKKNVVLVFTDVTAPALPAVVSEKKLPDVSVGELLAAPGMTQEQVLKTCVPCEKNPYISFLGYKAGENVFTHAEYSKEKAVDMLVLLRHIADYVIVDCTSLLTGNVLATTALEVADDVLRVCGCDLKAVSYFSSYLSLVADRKFKPEQHIKVLSNTRPYQGGSEYENSFGGVKYRLVRLWQDHWKLLLFNNRRRAHFNNTLEQLLCRNAHQRLSGAGKDLYQMDQPCAGHTVYEPAGNTAVGDGK